MIAEAGTVASLVVLVGQAVPGEDKIPTYGAMGLTFALLLYLLRRWRKQADDAMVAAETARDDERRRARLELDKVEARHAVDMQVLITDQANMRRVLSRMLGVWMDDSLTADDKAKIRTEALDVLFPPMHHIEG